MSRSPDDVLHYLHRSDVRSLLRLLYDARSPISHREVLRSLKHAKDRPIAVCYLVEGERLGLVERMSENDSQIALTRFGRKIFAEYLELCRVLETEV